MAGYNRKEKKYNYEHDEEAAPEQVYRNRSKSGHHQLPLPVPDSAIAAISSWAEAEPGNSLIKEPLFITRYRSQTLINSSSSEDTSSTPHPLLERSTISLIISLLALTSSPRVGSSRRNKRGFAASQRPNTIFCWFPPLRVPTALSFPDALIFKP